MGRNRLSYEIRNEIIDLFENKKKVSEIVQKIGKISKTSIYKIIKIYKVELL